MVILRTQNKITDFFMILAWASPFKYLCYGYINILILTAQGSIPAGIDPRAVRVKMFKL